MDLAAVVTLQFEVIFELAHLGCPIQIARFKPRLKYQCCVLRRLQLIQVWQLVIVARFLRGIRQNLSATIVGAIIYEST